MGILITFKALIKIKKFLQQWFKKQGLSKKTIDFAVGMEMLNLSPCPCKGVKEGYVIVNEEV